jgi:hypothetical protein
MITTEAAAIITTEAAAGLLSEATAARLVTEDGSAFGLLTEPQELIVARLFSVITMSAQRILSVAFSAQRIKQVLLGVSYG